MYEDSCQCSWCQQHRQLLENSAIKMVSNGKWFDRDEYEHNCVLEHCIPYGSLSADYLLVDGSWTC